jgi:hypothetical protein
MLRYPEHGWCKVEIGDFIGDASYLMDVPFNCLNSFITYFTKGNSINSIAIAFDEEGTEFTVVSSFDGTFIIIERGNEPELKCYQNINIVKLANELIEDLKRDFDGWVNWECYGEPEEGRAEELKNAIEELKKLVDKF